MRSSSPTVAQRPVHIAQLTISQRRIVQALLAGDRANRPAGTTASSREQSDGR